MKPQQVRRAIREVLLRTRQDLYSPAVENLLFGTAAHESMGFQYIWQINGPALSIFQIEPATLDDLYEHFLKWKPALHRKLERLRPPDMKRSEALIYCLAYAILAARLHYLRYPEPIPQADDLEGMAKLYKHRWNTSAGAATEQDFIDAYERYAE